MTGQYWPPRKKYTGPTNLCAVRATAALPLDQSWGNGCMLFRFLLATVKILNEKAFNSEELKVIVLSAVMIALNIL